MYKDLISYKLAENITEEHLLKVAAEILENWMSKLPGFISWEINKAEDGSYIDIVSWESKEAAKAAEAKMGEVPNAAAWFACYEAGSISSNGVSLCKRFKS